MSKLEKYEKMQDYILKSYDDCLKDLARLKEADKLKSVTYRQLLARKLKFEDLLSFYKMFDLM